jgi:hypothetical protein
MPGAMPEIVPSPDFGANIDRLLTERSMVLQAWGAYGVLWPVIHQWLGVSPDLGRNRVSVVPQLPESETKASVVADGAMGCRILEQSNRAFEEVHRCFLLARVRCGMRRFWTVSPRETMRTLGCWLAIAVRG